MKTPRLLIVAGGTGGHISPGLALGEEAAERQAEVMFLSIPRNRGYAGFRKVPFPLEWYDAPALKKDFISLIGFLPAFVRSTVQAMRLIEQFQPTAVVVMGGYPSLPAAIAALVKGRPLFLCEQNAIHGKVTRLLKRFARETFLTFGEGDDTGLCTGNPVRRTLKERAMRRTRKTRTLPAQPTVLTLGGSQGARQLNQMLLRLWKDYPELAGRYRWIVQAGESLLADFQREVDTELPAAIRKRITAFGFDADIFRFFEKADLVFSRAGAGNITEAALFHLPMILLPYPFAADNHQRANAAVVQRQGAAILIDRKDSEPEELAAALTRLSNKLEYKKMAEKVGIMAKPDAAQHIVDEIFARSEP